MLAPVCKSERACKSNPMASGHIEHHININIPGRGVFARDELRCVRLKYMYNITIRHYKSNIILFNAIMNGEITDYNERDIEEEEEENIDPIWKTSKTTRQIYALGEVEKVRDELWSCSTVSYSLVFRT